MALFDKAAESYDSWYATDLGQAVDKVERDGIKAAFKPEGKKVLEVGCGTGNYTMWLAGEGFEVTAVDVSPEMIKIARAKLNSQGLAAEWILGDIKEIDFLGEYDGIISVTAMEFIPNVGEVLGKLFARLKSGGVMVIGVIAANSPWSSLYGQIAQNDPDSVFAKASFYASEDILGWEIGAKPEIDGVLYFSPDVAGVDEALKLEVRQEGAPGFLIAKWVKI